MFKILIFLLPILQPHAEPMRKVRLATSLAINIYNSPCPDVFQYYIENNQMQYGLIRIRVPDGNVIVTNVEISVGNAVQNYNGELDLVETKERVLDDIINKRFIDYKLYFPRWYNTVPRITKIAVNGELICTGSPIELETVQVLTTITLQHTLRVSFGPNKDLVSDTRYEQPNIQNPSINFNPVTPKDPGKVFPGNPFFYTTTLPPTFANLPSVETTNVITTVRPKFPIRFKPEIPITKSPAVLDDYNFIYKKLLYHGINGDGCGVSISTNSLVAHGQGVHKGEYPWLVAIFLVKSLGPEFVCGGNLLSTKVVITAAHCMKVQNRVVSPEKIFLRMGELNIHQWTQMSDSRTVGVYKIRVHPDYHPMSADADIALLTLLDEVEFTKVIRPICLWSDEVALSRIVGAVGSVAGWGKDETNSVITSEPKVINFPVVSQEVCLRSHSTFREITSQRTFCAGYKNGSGPCNGDSGGGFILKRRDRWILRGLVAMSIAKDRSCDFSQYFVFTDVAKFLEWIVKSLDLI